MLYFWHTFEMKATGLLHIESVREERLLAAVPDLNFVLLFTRYIG